MNSDDLPPLPSSYIPHHEQHDGHHHSDVHGHHQHEHAHAHDLNPDASLGSEYFVPENGGQMSLNDGSRESEEMQMQQDQAPKSRKRKLQLACHFCRRRKLKCDGTRPTCDNCDKRNESCQWDDSVRRRGPGKRTKALRDRAADEAAGAGLHEATGLGSKHMDPNAYHVDTASSVADTNAALIAAVTAAAAEGAGGMDDAFGTGEISGSGEGYGGHEHDDGEETGDIVAHLAEVASATGSQPLDPNIDPSLTELGPGTLADASSSPISLAGHSQTHNTLTPLEQQQLQAALQLQRQEHLLQQQQHQQQQQQRKMGGVGVGVGGSVQIQAPNFGVIQTPHGFGLSHLGAGPSGGDSSAAEEVGADALDWDKGYNFSAWPDLDLGGATH